MSRKNMDDIFRDGLKNYNSEIDPNEIWAGIQEKKPNPDSDSKKPFAWWILGSLLLVITATVLLSSTANKQRNAIETAEARVTNMGILNNTTSNTEATINITDSKFNTANSLPDNNEHIDKETLNTVSKFDKKKIADKVSLKRAVATSISNTIQIEHLNTRTTNNNNKNNLLTAPSNTNIIIPSVNTNYNNTSTNKTIKATTKTTKSKVIAFEFLETKEAIPVIPMTVDTKDNEETDAMPDMRIPEDKIAEGCYGGPAFSFAFGAHVSPDLVMHNISSTNQDLFPYIDERRKTEKLLESYHVGLDVYIQHRDGLFLRSGLEYAQINKRFKFDETWQNETMDTTFTREKRTTNRYRMIDIPLTVGYEFGVYDWNLSLYVEAGASMNVLFKKKGDILDPNSPADYFEPISITDGAANRLDSYVDNVGLSILGGIGMRYELSDGLFIYAQPAGKLYLNSFTKKDNDVDEKFSRFGINFGAIYKL